MLLQVGLLIRRYLPKLACVLAKTLKPIAALFLFIIITFGVYANLFLFSLMDAKVCSLPVFSKQNKKKE